MATLVVGGATPSQLFAAVAEECARTVDVATVNIARYESDSAVVVASYNQPEFAPGGRWPLDGPSLYAVVHRTGRPAHIADYSELPGAVAAGARASGVHAGVGVPIVVDGEVWGVIAVGARKRDDEGPSFPESTQEIETRLTRFTELVATAISNAEARDHVRGLAVEQAALRRVATLVAEGGAPTALFDAVAQEVAAVLGVSSASVSRFLSDRSSVVLASHNDPGFPVGSRWRADESTLNSAILETGRPARIDQAAMSGPIADASQISDVRSVVGAPIVVEGGVWGMVAVGRQHSDEPLPPDTESRVAAFTELVATAISNAEARDHVRALAEEQAALRRVAELVARESSPVDVFVAVTEEAARVLGVAAVGMLRFEPDETATLVAQSDTPWDPPPLGTRFPMDGDNVVTTVLRTGQTARLDDWSSATGTVAAMAETLGVSSCVATPIVVEGGLWGTMIAATSLPDPLPPGTESRIGQFTGLVATAISNADARGSLRLLAEEQAALRRVATLVAQGVPPAQVFAAVTTEVAGLFSTMEPSILATVIRFDPGPECVLVGASSPYEGEPIGARWEPKELYVSTRVLRTGRSARIDEADVESGGPDAEALRRRGFLHQVGSPVVVEGRLWGAVTLNSGGELPPDTDERLENFTELVATAISNTEARDGLARLATEQAALGRVATLVAAGAPAEQVFAAVADEVSSLLGLERIELVRYDRGTAGTVIAASGDHPFPAGTTWSLDDPSVMAVVARTGSAARIDDYSSLGGEIARVARGAGFQSAIGAPITIEGNLWGVIIAISTDPEPIPEQSEARLAQFTDLVATAVANADARHELERVAAEQAALRRAATLVAEGASADELFSAVAQAVTELPGVELVAMSRFEPEASRTLVAAWGDAELARRVGSRWSLGESPSSSQILATGRPLRVDLDEDEVRHGPAADLGVRSYVGSPIEVEGRVWGALFAMARSELPADTERRLTNFTGLVATAISNADARDSLRLLAEEQAALSRVATLVARGATPEDVFAAVAQEVGLLFDADLTVLGRYEGDGAVTLGSWGSSPDNVIPEGTRSAIGGRNVLSEVARTGEPARLDGYADATGEAAEIARRFGWHSSIAAPIVDEGRVWGVILVATTRDQPFPPGAEHRLAAFTDLAATSVGNADAHAELVASRARIVAAGDQARRRIERNLHDGTQQQLIALGLDLQAVRATVPEELHESHAGFDRMEREIEGVLDDVRELSRGLHPALLTRAGLAPSIRALARRSPIPVELEIEEGERPPEPIETAVYFVVSEALANAVKYSEASTVSVKIWRTDSALAATVEDDGVGGATTDGSGVIGLVDRVEALGGRFALRSPPGEGTCVSIELPLPKDDE